MTSEQSDQLAQVLLLCASQLGAVDQAIREAMRPELPDAFRNEPEAIDLLTGPENADLRYALRSLAMRLDRGAIGAQPSPKTA